MGAVLKDLDTLALFLEQVRIFPSCRVCLRVCTERYQHSISRQLWNSDNERLVLDERKTDDVSHTHAPHEDRMTVLIVTS